jgi:hypothetical protein
MDIKFKGYNMPLRGIMLVDYYKEFLPNWRDQFETEKERDLNLPLKDQEIILILVPYRKIRFSFNGSVFHMVNIDFPDFVEGIHYKINKKERK